MAVIGRETELRLVESFVDDAGPGTRVLVLHGEAGIGKTTIWHAGLDAATRHGYRVVVTRPTAAEARLPFAGMNDLFGDLVDSAGPHLPPPQQAALDVALMRSGAGHEPMQPLALSLAVLELLRVASADQPLALAIDDLQWLDESSAGVLRFALRRLESEPVVVIGTQRTDATVREPALLADLPAERITRIQVTGLGAEAIDRLIDESLDLQLAPTMLRRVHAISGGNPFYAVEIGRAMQARGMERATGEVPLPESLTGLLRERLEALPHDARAVVAHAAALSQPTTALLEAAVGEDHARSGLIAAREAAVLASGADPIRFTHPLLAAEAYAGLDDAGRREVHRRLARVVTGPEELARHLALAASGPDPDVAAALDAAAAHAHDRNAPDAAAELSEQAAAMTPDTDPARARRMAAAGRYRLLAGDLRQARQLLERALEEPAAASGPERAELLFRLATVRELIDDFTTPASLGLEALRHAGDDAALAVQVKLLLAGVTFITGRDWSTGANHAFEAMQIAEESGDPAILAAAIGPYASWRYATGHGFDRTLRKRAAELEPWMRQLRVLDQAEFDFGNIEFMEGETAAAFESRRDLLDRAERVGDYSSLPFLLGNMSIGDFLVGQSDVARERIDRAQRLSRTTDQGTALVHALACEARLEARLGNAERAVAAAEEARGLMATSRWAVGKWWLAADIAQLELSRDRPEAALEWVAGAIGPSAEDEAGRRRWAQAVAVEALVALGRHDEARNALELLESQVTRDGSRRLWGDALRARARLMAATGESESAEIAIWEAEAIHRRMEDRWELGRTLLVAAEIHRRARRRAKARAALTEALDAFEFLGARLWAAQASEQLGRIGAARSDGGLTPTQREVAELVASGLTNRQVADRLYMSAHTVEAHLSAVYRALGIRSRVELDAALATGHAPVRDSVTATRDSEAGSAPEN